MATKTITQFGTISGVAAGDELLIWDANISLTRKVAYSALAAAVLTAPTITDFTNATHTHQTTAQGDKLDHGAALTGLSNDDHTQYLLATGSRAGATSSAQAFTSGIVAGNGSSGIVVIDTATSGEHITTKVGGTKRGTFSSTTNTMDVDVWPDAAASATFRYFRNTNTSGARQIDYYLGDGTGTLVHRIRTDNTSVFNSNQGSAQDLQYRGQTLTNLFFVDVSADKVGLGTNAPATLLDIADTNAGTAAIQNAVTLRSTNAGTPAAGFGVGVNVLLKSSTTADQSAGRLSWHWADATHASRAAVGRLTAYYTSTERAVIVWTATSSSATVAIAGTLSVSEKLSASATGESIAVGSSNVSTYVNIAGTRSYFGYDGNNVVVQGGASKGVKLLVNNATFGSGSGAYLDSTGQFGIGITPAALLHGHDGSGGFLFINRTSIGGTAVTVIANGTGDVTQRVAYFGWVENSAGFSQSLSGNRANGASGVVTDGTNDLTIAVAADGTFTLQATAGAATWTVVAMAVWR